MRSLVLSPLALSVTVMAGLTATPAFAQTAGTLTPQGVPPGTPWA